MFDFDYSAMESFNNQVCYASLIFPCTWPSVLCLFPCCIANNNTWDARSQHVALTVDGIKFVRDKRKTCWGLDCSDAGKSSKTVPFDKLTDCDVEEPAGNACICCVPNILTTVNVDTASSGTSQDGIPRHELALKGLTRPLEFKRAVWAMKRGNLPQGLDPAAQRTAEAAMAEASRRAHTAPVVAAMDRAGGGGGDLSVPLLTEIRDELRELNRNMTKK